MYEVFGRTHDIHARLDWIEYLLDKDEEKYAVRSTAPRRAVAWIKRTYSKG